MPKLLKLHNLRRPQPRQSWHKLNLYNLAKMPGHVNVKKSAKGFAKRWASKKRSRSYHGLRVKEGQWEKLFSRGLHGVVPMDSKYLGETTGSIESSGRGLGLDQLKPVSVQKTPYMNMTYAPMERRLETAVFRALFASSIQQARQFVVHGAVRVNGRELRIPSYQLNPGDLFQVEPAHVLKATGAPKSSTEARRIRRKRKLVEAIEKGEAPPKKEQRAPPDPSTQKPARIRAEELKSELLRIGEQLIQAPKNIAPAVELRQFVRTIRKVLAKHENDTILEGSLEEQIDELESKLHALAITGEDTTETQVDAGKAMLNSTERINLADALQVVHDNPTILKWDSPFSTPWVPRPYMSAFAFIPRYLEVMPQICSAVYLRHPVARPGLAEVPSPISEEMHGLAYKWYLRRR